MENNLDADYDAKSDVLYISFGEPKPAICEEIFPEILLRRDENTNEPVGLTIIHFKYRLEKMGVVL